MDLAWRNVRKRIKLALGLLVWALVALSGCARAPIKEADQAMRMTERAPPQLSDDLSVAQFLQALADHVRFFRSNPDRPDDILRFGPIPIPRQAYLQELEKFLEKAAALKEEPQQLALIEQEFKFFEVYGGEDWGEVMITGYYEPVIPGSRKRTSRYSTPLYRCPADLVSVELQKFAETFPGLAGVRDLIWEQRSRDAVLRGRLAREGRSPVPSIIPYYSRMEIDGEKRLQGKDLELAWVDPIHAFFLQIQGSGVVDLGGDQQMRVGYVAQNGHPYVPIGRFLTDRIPLEKMSMQAIERELRKMPSELRDEILYKNPSYVFFERLKGRAKTASGIEVSKGRTIATDARYFPKGALAYLQFRKPLFSRAQEAEPSSWQDASRFVLDQDTGGAIRGTHRVDLYFGEGDSAAQAAGVMKEKGRLYYLVPKALLP